MNNAKRKLKEKKNLHFCYNRDVLFTKNSLIRISLIARKTRNHIVYAALGFDQSENLINHGFRLKLSRFLPCISRNEVIKIRILVQGFDTIGNLF